MIWIVNSVFCATWCASCGGSEGALGWWKDCHVGGVGGGGRIDSSEGSKWVIHGGAYNRTLIHVYAIAWITGKSFGIKELEAKKVPKDRFDPHSPVFYTGGGSNRRQGPRTPPPPTAHIAPSGLPDDQLSTLWVGGWRPDTPNRRRGPLGGRGGFGGSARRGSYGWRGDRLTGARLMAPGGIGVWVGRPMLRGGQLGSRGVGLAEVGACVGGRAPGCRGRDGGARGGFDGCRGGGRPGRWTIGSARGWPAGGPVSIG